MAVDDELAQLTRRKHQRAGARVNSRVAIAVEWTEAGQSARVDGHTVDVSSRGCQIVLPKEFAVGQRLRLTNLLNERVCEATVIWRGHQGHSGWELGLELQADGNFWGSVFQGEWEDL